MDKKTERYSNFDLLKVISILMILTLHYFNGGMGGGLSNTPYGTFNYYAMYYIKSLSIVAVNCFILITGYFMIGKNTINLKKALDLIVVTVFYGAVLYALVVIFTDEVLSIRGIAHAIVPFHGPKWFVSSYIILFLLTPFINLLIIQLSKKQNQQLLVILIVSFSVLPTILTNLPYNDKGYGLLTFFLLYCLGAYIKLHFIDSKSKIFYLGIYMLSTTITYCLSVILGPSNFAWDYNTLFNIISSVSLFLLFSRFNLKSTKINFLATFTFPIYIIHTDISLTHTLYRDILKTNQFWGSQWFLTHLIISVALLFVGCVVIEIGRRYFWKKIENRFGNVFDTNLLDTIYIRNSK